ncbi:MAG TPA: DmsC/YnfH family molybdoenzyme membrane anchor subunit, partial [Chthoniobacteraceae bacterium]
AAAGALTFSSAWPQITKLWPAMRKMEGWIQPAAFSPALTLITAVLALAGVFCSAMIYIDTRRSFWAHSLTSVRFFGTMLLLGVAGTAAVLACWQAFTGALLAEAIRSFAIAATIIRTALFGWEALNFRQALSDSTDPNHFSALTLWKLRRPLLRTSLALFVCSTTSGLLTITESGWFGMACATLSFALSFASQTVERYCFFAAVVAPRMPGSFAPSSGPAIQFAAPHQSPLGKDRRSWFRR